MQSIRYQGVTFCEDKKLFVPGALLRAPAMQFLARACVALTGEGERDASSGNLCVLAILKASAITIADDPRLFRCMPASHCDRHPPIIAVR